MARRTETLRRLVAREEVLILPGAYDALSARIAEQAGFEAVYMTGSGVSASLLGKPDVGLTTMTEMADQARRMAHAVDVPVIADADTGFGNALNVIETVRAYEAAGVAGLHIEDQVSPKKCGHFEGKALVSVAEMSAKIRAAAEARRDADFFVIARTDARTVAGLEEAIERGQAYASAGADAIFVETPLSREEYVRIADALGRVPLVADVTEGGKSPPLTADELYRVGFKIVLFSASAIRAAMKTLQEFYRALKRDRTTNGLLHTLVAFEERNRILGLPEIYDLEHRYAANISAPE